MASLETKHTYAGGIAPAAFGSAVGRIVPYLIINTGMLPHQFSAFAEGLFGPLHSEFERTPKAASVTVNLDELVARRGACTGHQEGRHRQGPLAVRVTEAFFVAQQLGWAVIFAMNGLVLCVIARPTWRPASAISGTTMGTIPARCAL